MSGGPPETLLTSPFAPPMAACRCVHLDSVCVGVGRHGRYEVHAVQMGSKLARLNMDVRQPVERALRPA